MPLVRYEVKNEYGLGHPELYREVDSDKPKALLDGIAVSGLVGILRQLGDLAGFAAEVFLSIQEQVLVTASRSHKLMVRVQNIEAKLPPLEKAILAQTSHIHFAYTPGSKCHPYFQDNRNLFIYNDLPWFIMDSYEECRDPPRLHLLDKFDSGGPGSCLKRYSDPTFFRRTSANSNDLDAEKTPKDKKPRKAKKRRSSRRTEASLCSLLSNQSGRMHFTPTIANGQASPSHTASSAHRSSQRTEGSEYSASVSNQSSRMHFTPTAKGGQPSPSHTASMSSQRTEVSVHSVPLSNHSGRTQRSTPVVNEQASPSHTASTADMTLKFDTDHRSDSFDSRTASSYIEHVFDLEESIKPEEQKSNVYSSSLIHCNDIASSDFLDIQLGVADDDFPKNLSSGLIATTTSSVLWEEKEEVVEFEASELQITHADMGTHEKKIDEVGNADKESIVLADKRAPKQSSPVKVDEKAEVVECFDKLGDENEASDLPITDAVICTHEKKINEVGNVDNENTVFADKQAPKRSSSITWDEKIEVAECYTQKVDENVAPELPIIYADIGTQENKIDEVGNADTDNVVLVEKQAPKASSSVTWYEKVEVLECYNQQDDENEAPELRITDADIGSLEKKIDGIGDADTENIVLADKRARKSTPSDTWDEKVEAAERYNQQDDENEAPELPIIDGDLGTREKILDVLGNDDKENVVLADKGSPKPSSSEEVESETDNYMDALNAIESESEGDLDCQTKHEVEKMSYMKKEQVQDDLNVATGHVIEEVPLKAESSPAHYFSLENEVTSDLASSISSKSSVHAETSDNAVIYPMPEHSPSFESSKSSHTKDSSKVEFKVSSPLSIGSEICSGDQLLNDTVHISEKVPLKRESVPVHDPSLESPTFGSSKSSNTKGNSKAQFKVSNHLSINSETCSQDRLLFDKNIDTSCKPEVADAETTTVHPVSLWTNGGLLGLQPSKPPDFVVLGTARMDSVAHESRSVCPKNHTSTISSNPERVKSGKMSKDGALSSQDSTSWHGYQDAEVGKSSDSHFVDRSSPYAGGTNDAGAILGNQLLLDANVVANSNEACFGNDGNSSQIFSFGNGFLANSFRRRMPSVPYVPLEADSSPRAGAVEQNNGHVNASRTTQWKAFNDHFRREPLVGSLTSSPPVEHMKISFCPNDGFEASKLQLRLSDGNSRNGSVRDMFLSFQLVPEPAASLQDMGYVSDDDTFCRSSPYMSDESPSHQSESDFEVWESSESSDCKDHQLYNGTLGKISSVDFGSSSLVPGDMGTNFLQLEPECSSLGAENCADPSLAVSSLNLPCFDTFNSFPREETEAKLSTIESHHSRLTSPVPPPLSPAQWRVSKPPSVMETDQQHAASEAGGCLSDSKLLKSRDCQQSKQTLGNGRQTSEAVAVNPKYKEQENLCLQKKANKNAGGKMMDQQEDFLHQIRAKVVGSDDGEDDNWSEVDQSCPNSRSS